MVGYRVLIVTSLAASLLMAGVGMTVALLPQRILSLAGSLQDVSYLASYFALSYVLIQLPSGRLADRMGVKPLLLLGYALCCISGLVFYQASSPQGVFLGRFIQGAGEAPVWALGPALLALSYPRAKGKVIGIYNASIHIGLTAGPLLGLLLAPDGTENIPFLVFALLCAYGGVTVLLFLPRLPSPSGQAIEQAAKPRHLVAVLTTRGPLLVLFGIVLYGAGYGTFVSVLPGSLALFRGFDAVHIGVLFALFYVAISLAQLVVGPLSDRHGRQLYMIAGLAMAAIGFAAFECLSLPWIYAPLALASFGLGVFCVSSLAYLNDCVPDSLKASVSAGYYLSWGLGYFLGPLIVGWLAEVVHPQAGYRLLALAIALQAGVFWLSHIRGSRRT